MHESTVSTLPATMGDLDRMFECYRHTMRQYVEAAWGWDEAFQREGFQRAIALTTSEIIEVRGHFAGFIWLQAAPQGMMLRIVCIEPAYQGAGIGSHLVKAAVDRYPSLRLKVFKSNRAVKLYRRLGFREVGDDEYTWEMVHGQGEALG